MSVPSRVGVIGGGTMGAGIAETFARAGSEVLVVEVSGAAAEAAQDRLTENLGKAASHDSSIDVGQVRERLSVVSSYDRLRDADLVIEAVPEDRALKASALGRAESVMRRDSWLATNTSSLSVTDLCGDLARPERFCGLHFFNPVPRSALVEIVRTPVTCDALLDSALDWVDGLGKTPVTVQDSPGFASSRLGLALALEAMRMVEDGVASAEDIDRAMVLGYRHAAGPLRTTDLVGLDVRLGIAEHLASTLGPRFEPPRILREKVEAGLLGRKSGQGFFTYPAAGRAS